MTHLADSIRSIRQMVAAAKAEGKLIGLVPTMGALHVGHARLIQQARQESGFVVASIFVNPLQFGPGEDFEKYPRDLDKDVEKCQSLGVDAVFAPPVEVLYPGTPLTFVEVAKVTEGLCGRFRPGHFRGVTTVVLKLLNIVQPHRAYFGEKDAQQLAAIKRMVIDLDLPVEVIGVPTVREPDGLAMSSRNRYLTPEQRLAAPTLYRALQAAGQTIAAGVRDPAQVRQAALSMLECERQIEPQYVEVVDAELMTPVEIIEKPVRIAAAVWLGSTRLIDNIYCEVK